MKGKLNSILKALKTNNIKMWKVVNCVGADTYLVLIEFIRYLRGTTCISM